MKEVNFNLDERKLYFPSSSLNQRCVGVGGHSFPLCGNVLTSVSFEEFRFELLEMFSSPQLLALLLLTQVKTLGLWLRLVQNVNCTLFAILKKAFLNST